MLKLFVVLLLAALVNAMTLSNTNFETYPDGESACICTAPKCSGQNPDYECGVNKVCKFLDACGWRCHGGFLALCVAI